MILFPFIAVSSEKLTAYRVALAIITSATIYSLEVALIYIIFNRYGVKFKEGIFRLLELKEEEYRRLSKKERDMFYKLGFVIIGTPGLAMIISGGILEWGNPITALKFLIVFSAFLIPLLQVCILPLIVLFTTYNRFIAKDLNTCIESSVFWTRLSLLGLLLVVLSLFSSDEKESLPIVSTILNNWDLFLIMSLFNVLVGVLNYAICGEFKGLSRSSTARFLLFASYRHCTVVRPFWSCILSGECQDRYDRSFGYFYRDVCGYLLLLRIFGYSIASIEKAVASAEPEKTLKNVLFWILWVNASVLGIGIALTIHILSGL